MYVGRKTCVGYWGRAQAYQCDIADPASLTAFVDQLLQDDRPIDILVLSAAQWLEGDLESKGDIDVISTINSGLTGNILLTRALLPSLRLSAGADIMVMVSVCGISQFIQSGAHPAFFAAKQGIGGFCHNIAHHLAAENIRVTGYIRRILK